MMAGAAGQQMAGMMGSMMQGVNQPIAGMPGTLPPPPVVQYNIAVNGQTTGPFGIEQLTLMAQAGQLTTQTMVWKQGMSAWTQAGNVQELSALFAAAAPPPPPPPPGV